MLATFVPERVIVTSLVTWITGLPAPLVARNFQVFRFRFFLRGDAKITKDIIEM